MMWFRLVVVGFASWLLLCTGVVVTNDFVSQSELARAQLTISLRKMDSANGMATLIKVVVESTPEKRMTCDQLKKELESLDGGSLTLESFWFSVEASVISGCEPLALKQGLATLKDAIKQRKMSVQWLTALRTSALLSGVNPDAHADAFADLWEKVNRNGSVTERSDMDAAWSTAETWMTLSTLSQHLRESIEVEDIVKKVSAALVFLETQLQSSKFPWPRVASGMVIAFSRLSKAGVLFSEEVGKWISGFVSYLTHVVKTPDLSAMELAASLLALKEAESIGVISFKVSGPGEVQLCSPLGRKVADRVVGGSVATKDLTPSGTCTFRVESTSSEDIISVKAILTQGSESFMEIGQLDSHKKLEVLKLQATLKQENNEKTIYDHESKVVKTTSTGDAPSVSVHTKLVDAHGTTVFPAQAAVQVHLRKLIAGDVKKLPNCHTWNLHPTPFGHITSVPLTGKKTIPQLNGEYSLEMVFADWSWTPLTVPMGYLNVTFTNQWKTLTVPSSDHAKQSTILSGQITSYPAPLISHSFQPEERRASAKLSLPFALCCTVLPLVFLFSSWWTMGANVKGLNNVPQSRSWLHIGFQILLAMVCGLTGVYWYQLTLFRFLGWIIPIGFLAGYFGHNVLCDTRGFSSVFHTSMILRMC
eukprot:GHVN01066738.1.p1 GENE.GHVN01066738.1~~GHVN01066738.1.p1  ORF type:complete len:648 (+),score=22.54 GHVN01066738.1:50-1993(+)